MNSPKLSSGPRAEHARRKRLLVELPTPVDGARWIVLSRGYFALIDSSDYDKVSPFNWSADTTSGSVYAKRYMNMGGGVLVLTYLHRFIMDAKYGEEVDHKDGNGLDCRRSNLRVCNSQKNNMNRRKSPNGTSSFKGVSWDKSRDQWRATIKINRKMQYLGRFTSEVVAAETYDSAAMRLFGEFAVLNFP